MKVIKQLLMVLVAAWVPPSGIVLDVAAPLKAGTLLLPRNVPGAIQNSVSVINLVLKSLPTVCLVGPSEARMHTSRLNLS